jgi:membrane protein implicated in regulation of membrane protease activity
MAIEQYMWIIWLVLFVAMLIIEAIGPALVSIWFALGAVIALILSFIPEVA